MIFIPLLTLFIYFIYYQKVNKGYFGIISLLILTYIITLLFGVILYYSNILIPVYEISFSSMLYFSILILIALVGFSPFKDCKIDSIRISNVRLLNLLERILLYGSIFSIIFFLPFVYRALQGDINQNRLNLQETSQILGSYGLINSFASLFANLFMLTQMFFFINLIPHNGIINRRRSTIMLFASMAYIIYILAYVGRDGVVFWIMSFVFQYLFFRKFIDSNILKSIKRKIILFSFVLLIPFMQISIARFSDSPLGVYLEIMNYMGQQIINFNDQFNINAPLQFGNVNFPAFANIIRQIGIEIPEKMEQKELFSYFLQNQVNPWTFTTFIGSFKVDFGKMGTIFVTLILFFITYRLSKRSLRYNSFPISNFVLFILLYQSVYFGVFYFRLYSANYYIIAMILIYLIFKIKTKNKKCLVLHRSNGFL